VLAPVRVKVADDDGERYIVRGFKVEHVFAACQTDGDGDIPEPMRPTLLAGEGPEGAWDALAALVESHGFTIARTPLFPANGTTSFASKVVTVADRLDGAASVKTLAHELAHVMLHEHADYHGNRGRCESRRNPSPIWCAEHSASRRTRTPSPTSQRGRVAR